MKVDLNKLYEKSGGPAYPYSVQQHDGCTLTHSGMSVRDYFAAQAIDRIISLSQDRDGGWDADSVAAGCYAVADAMIAYRDADQKKQQ